MWACGAPCQACQAQPHLLSLPLPPPLPSQDPIDEALFDYYGASELVRIDVRTGAVARLGPPRLYTAASPSPDGAYLAVSWLEKPYSYAFPAGRFPRVTEVWRAADGARVRRVADLPLAEDVPIVMDAVRTGPRSLAWRPDADASLAWVEALDGGDPRTACDTRDALFTLDAAAPPSTPPTRLATTAWRCGGAAWGDGGLALLYESQYSNRRSRVWAFEPGKGEGADSTKVLLMDRDYEDAYADPGSPMLARTPGRGTYVLARPDGRRALLLQGSGAGPDGSRPFLDLMDVDTKEASGKVGVGRFGMGGHRRRAWDAERRRATAALPPTPPTTTPQTPLQPVHLPLRPRACGSRRRRGTKRRAPC